MWGINLHTSSVVAFSNKSIVMRKTVKKAHATIIKQQIQSKKMAVFWVAAPCSLVDALIRATSFTSSLLNNLPPILARLWHAPTFLLAPSLMPTLFPAGPIKVLPLLTCSYIVKLSYSWHMAYSLHR
jgi:hypothetical protein